MSDAAAWVQAIGSVVAILVAVAIPAWQRWASQRDAEKSQRERNYSELCRLVAAFRAEIEQAVEAAGHWYFGVKVGLSSIESARKAGKQIIDRGPLSVASTTITDATIYNALSSEIGRFPPQLICEIVQFYEGARQLNRIVSSTPTVIESIRSAYELLPRIRICGAITIRRLAKYESSGFDASADLTPSQAELLSLTREYEYPLDKVLTEFGLTLNQQTQTE
jgi:hypothetical protein